jgi:hypothetical protein
VTAASALVVTAGLLCPECAADVASSAAFRHTVPVITALPFDHSEPPHTERYEPTFYRGADQGTYPPPGQASPVTPPRMLRGRAPHRMTGRTYGVVAPVVVVEKPADE